jgi:putative tryptophan/tyrosine transport system substrate-binding protein
MIIYSHFLLAIILLTTFNRVEAQQTARVGILLALSRATISDRIDAFEQGLRALGYIDQRDIFLEYRSADGKFDQLPHLARDLVNLKAKIIVSGGPTATRPARQATRTIPIVMAQDTDPVGNGFVNSLARPGGNITGLSNYHPDLTGKQLELLKEILPRLVRVAVFGNSNEPGNKQALKEIELAARQLGLRPYHLDVRDVESIDAAFKAASKERVDAALILSSPVSSAYRQKIAEAAAKRRIPSMYQVSESVESGGLVTYGISTPDLWRRAATYVDKILKGAKPSDLPVEQPTKFELIINLKAAKQIGLTIPPNVLARADRVIR